MAAIEDILAETSSAQAPWVVIDGNNKESARIAALEAVANALEAAVPMTAPEADPEVEALAKVAFAKD